MQKEITTNDDEIWRDRLQSSQRQFKLKASDAMMAYINFGREVLAFRESCEKVQGGSEFSRKGCEWLGCTQPELSVLAAVGERADELMERFISFPNVSSIGLVARLPDLQFEKVIESVKPDMTVSQVKGLIREAKCLPEPSRKPVTLPEQNPVPSRDEIFESMKLMVDAIQESKSTKAQKDAILQAAQTTIDLIMARVDSDAEVIEKQKELDAKQAELDALIETKRQEEHAVKQLRQQLSDARSTVDRMMTYEEFKIVRGLLHPDRYPDDLKDRAGKAFDIFNRLEKAVNPHLGIVELRKRGWEHLSPYYKAKARKAK